MQKVLDCQATVICSKIGKFLSATFESTLKFVGLQSFQVFKRTPDHPHAGSTKQHKSHPMSSAESKLISDIS